MEDFVCLIDLELDIVKLLCIIQMYIWLYLIIAIIFKKGKHFFRIFNTRRSFLYFHWCVGVL